MTISKLKFSTLFASIALLFLACNGSEPTTIVVQPTVMQLKVGDMQTLQATVSPAADVVWTSSDDSVATVFHGIVTATGIGSATITASANDASAACAVYVTGTDGSTLALYPAVVSLTAGETYSFRCADVYGMPLTWSSSNESAATVNADGLVTAVSGGNTTISVTNGSETATAFVAVEHSWSDYQLVWSDEFEGSALDESIWNIEVGGGGWGNNELQYYTTRSENLRLANGCLEIQARKETYENREYTSARINTRGKKDFAYGRIEARVAVPVGGGTWPAFWMMGANYSLVGWPKCGEIDIMEHVGNQPTMTSFALHTTDKNGSKGNNWHATNYRDGLEGEFHVYGIEWKEEDYNGCDRIIFTVDGEECASSLENLANIDDDVYWPFNKAQFIIFNMAIGGNMGGSVNDDIFANDVVMKVDWVRVYQRTQLP